MSTYYILHDCVYICSQKSDIDEEMSSSTGSYESFSESTPLLSSDSSEVQVKKTKHGLSLVKPVLKHWLPLLMAVSFIRGVYNINRLYLLSILSSPDRLLLSTRII